MTAASHTLAIVQCSILPKLMRQSLLLVIRLSAVFAVLVGVSRVVESIATSNQAVAPLVPASQPIETSLSSEDYPSWSRAPVQMSALPQPLAGSSPVVAPISPTPLPTLLATPVRPEGSSQPVELSDAKILQQVNPAVVTIYVGRDVGSGSIVSADGLVITNTHVVRRAIRQNEPVTIRMATGNEYSGQVVATDRANDLALIRVAARSLPEVRLANTEVIQVGQTVYAIGSPFGRAGVMTTGRLLSITSKGDLQSSVLLKPGNSGGPLLNTQGEMIGVNKGIRPAGDGFEQATSLATSVLVAKSFIAQNYSNVTPVSEPRFVPGTNFPPGFPSRYDRPDR